MAEKLNTWTIYEKRTDTEYPESFVAVEFNCMVNPPQFTGNKMRCSHLEILRDLLRKNGFIQMSRDPVDDDSIIETWI